LLFVYWLSCCRWRLPFSSAGNYLTKYTLTGKNTILIQGRKKENNSSKKRLTSTKCKTGRKIFPCFSEFCHCWALSCLRVFGFTCFQQSYPGTQEGMCVC
jgi:hypothetical protein